MSDHVRLYYMRDNHTFLRLNGSVEEMMTQLMREFDEGDCYGMLCTQSMRDLGVVHANGRSKRETFWEAAHAWLTKAHERMAPAFADSDGGECD